MISHTKNPFLLRIVAASLLFVCTFPIQVSALPTKDLQVSPAVIDMKSKPRDIIKQSITIKNSSPRTLTLFPSVEDINPENGDQTFSYAADAMARSGSLANWIELSRGMIQLATGEEKTIPFVIHVNQNAVPGTYHAQITFTDGETRDETLKKSPAGSINVNLEIRADIKENLQLLKFFTDRVVFSGDDVLFNYKLENIGNQELQPGGEIRIYDRRGEEVATIDVNKEGKIVGPDQTSQLASAWSAFNSFGQYKALITINYGKTQTASVTDTIFFWIIPWKQLLGLLTATMIAFIILALYFNKWFEERHLNKLAVAGLLKTHPAAAAAYIPPFPPAPVRPLKPVVPPQPKKPKISWRNRAIEGIERIIAFVIETKRLFTVFKRSGRLTPESVSRKDTLQVNPIEVPTPSTEMAARVTYPTHMNHAQHATVDLKNVSKPILAQESTPQHVVNLKKPS